MEVLKMDKSPYPIGSFCDNYDVKLVMRMHESSMKRAETIPPETVSNPSDQSVIRNLLDANNKYISALSEVQNTNNLYLKEIHRLNQEVSKLQTTISHMCGKHN
jgi:hypothetical protein